MLLLIEWALKMKLEQFATVGDSAANTLAPHYFQCINALCG